MLKALTLLLVLCAGILITAPHLNFQDYLAPGDHGHDLYAAQAVMRGEIPDRDFWWNFGPLMPYYYGLFLKIFGANISSMVLAKLALRVLGGILVCLGMMEITSEIAAFLCACWFMLFQQDFFYAYNHFGGIVVIAGVAFCLLSYIQRNSSKAAWGALFFVFTLCLIKVNFGLAALAVSVITVRVCDHLRRTPFDTSKKLFFSAACIGIPVLIFIIYWSILRGLSSAEIHQCLPYTDKDQPSLMSPLMAMGNFLQTIWHTIRSTWMNFSFAVILNACALRCFYLLIKNKLPDARKISFLLSLGMLCLFYAANSHEYIKSGVGYRIYWAQPLSIMITFLLIDTAAQSIPKLARNIIFSLMTVMAVMSWFITLHSIELMKTEKHFLALPKGDVYVSNSPSWIVTVEQTTEFLNNTLKPDELFFALPYDDLYYFLTDRRSPTRQLIFFDYLNIPSQQERSVIAELEKNHVNYILVSSRAFTHKEAGLGFLGKTYCPLIANYIHKNFAIIARFGDWTNEAGWANNHGTVILKRRTKANAGLT